MFKSVLIAEDHESVSISVQKALADLGITRSDYAYYCDDALLRLKKGIQGDELYELLITDLSFEDDGREQMIPHGEGLIAAAKELQPGLKILVFSGEHRAALISALFHKLGINGYVRKARRDAQELKTAIENIYRNKQHLPAEFRQDIKEQNAHSFTAYDVTIIGLLSGGMAQKNIPEYLNQHKIYPSSLSSVEKRLNLIKQAMRFLNNEQLVAYCKDKGII